MTHTAEKKNGVVAKMETVGLN